MEPRRLLRWLLCPACFVAGHWALLARPSAVTSAWPRLWTPPAGNGTLQLLPPHPKTRGQAFELGWHAEYYASHCGGAAAQPSEACGRTLEQAGDAVLAGRSLTGAELAGMRELVAELDAARSIADRVLGFFSFVNIVWTVSIVGALATITPCLAYLFGPLMLRCCLWLFESVLLPAGHFLHRWGLLEAAAYALAFAFSAQSCRYPAGQADAALMVGLTGGLAFVPCWMYSAGLHAAGEGDAKQFLTLTFSSAALALAPLALIHDSRLLGFLTVLCIYGALGFVFLAFGFGFLIGFASEDALERCLVSSVLLVISFSLARISGVQPAVLHPFSMAVMVLGNNMYFLALLVVTSSWRSSPKTYLARQGAMVGSLLAALLVGSVYSIPSMTNTATTYMVLWIMEKELEFSWGPGPGMVVLFCNFVGLYFIAHYLHAHPQHIVSLFDSRGVYS